MRTTMIRWLAAALLGIPVWAHAQSCPVTAPANGFIGTCPTTLPSGSSCQFTCASGYNLSGPVTSCSNGVLTAQTCTPSPCVVNPPTNGGRGNCPTTLPSGNSCEITCNAGYTVNGAATTCSVGVLTPQTCTPSSCPVSTPANGTLGTCPSTLPSGTSCSIQCNTGFTLIGSATTCSFGNLTSQTCTPNACAVTAPANGMLGNCPGSLASGNSCSFTCNTGFTLNGAATTCSDGVLTAQTCSVTPPPPGDSADGPIPLWALGALALGLFGIASRRTRKAA